MPTLQERIDAATDQIEVDAGLLRDIVQGGAGDPDVVTAGGAVKPLAKAIAEIGTAPLQGLSATSVTNLAIGTGEKVFITQAQKYFAVGLPVMIVSAADPTTNWMGGLVTAYAGTSLTVDVTAVGGGGAHADWTIYSTAAAGEVALQTVAAAEADRVDAAASAAAASDSAAIALAAAASVGFSDVVFLTFADSPYAVVQAASGKLLNIDTSGGDVVVDLPEIAGLDLPFMVGVKKDTVDANTVIINRGGTDTFTDGATSKEIATVQGMTLVPDEDPLPDQWASAEWGGAAYSAGNGISLAGNAVAVDLAAADPGLEFSAGKLRTKTATDTAKGAVEKSTSAENVDGVAADKFPDVAGVKEMIDTHVPDGDPALITMGSTNTPAPGATRYFSHYIVDDEDTAKIPISRACTLKGLAVRTMVAPGVGQSFTYTVRKNGADTAITCTVSGTDKDASDLVNEAVFAAGDFFSLKIVASAGAITASAWQTASIGVNP